MSTKAKLPPFPTTFDALKRAWALDKSDKQTLQVLRDALIEQTPDGSDAQKWVQQRLGELNFRWKTLSDLKGRVGRYDHSEEGIDTSTWRLARAKHDIRSEYGSDGSETLGLGGFVRLRKGEVTVVSPAMSNGTIRYLSFSLYRTQIANSQSFELLEGEAAEDIVEPWQGAVPKVELKKFTANQRLSEETLAFGADIYVDGKKAGTVSNHGQGGPNEVHWINPDAEVRVDAWLDSQVQVYDEGSSGVPDSYQMNEDNFFGALAENELRKKDDARIAKKFQKDAAKLRAQGLTPVKYHLRDARNESFVLLGLRAGEHPSAGANMLMKKYKAEVLAAEVMP